jgi:PAS domain S-box-containing protein
MKLTNAKYQAEIDNYLAQVQKRTDKIIDKFVIVFFILGLVFAPIYNTWKFSLSVGVPTLALYAVARYLITHKLTARMLISLVLALFVLQYIGQLHGMAELHFFFFTNIALLILYQDWRVILPYTILTVLHHTLLAFFQWYWGMNDLAQYFISYTNITFLQMGFHFGIVALMAYIAILWAVMLQKNNVQLFENQHFIAEQNEKLRLSESKLQMALANTETEVALKTAHLQAKTQELLAAEEELRQNLEELQATQELIVSQKAEIEQKAIFNQAILDHSPITIVTLDTQGIITSVNQMVEKLVGYTANELVGKHTPVYLHDKTEIARELEAINGELGQHFTDLAEAFLARPRLEGATQKEWTFVRKDGSSFIAEVHTSPIKDKEGNLMGYIKMAKDITERKQAEAEANLFKTLMDNSTDAFQAATDNGKLIYMNKVGLNRLGLKKEQIKDLWVRDYEKLFEPEGSWEAHAAEMKELKQLTIQSINHDKTNNRDFPVEVSIRHVEIGEQGYLMATSRDITERRKQEAEIQAQNEELKASEEELKQNLEELQATQDKLQQINEEVQVKEAQIRRVINAQESCVFEAVLDTTSGAFSLLFVNDKVQAIFGATPEEALADINAIVGKMGAGEYARFGEALQQALLTMSEFSIVYSINKNADEIVWVNSYNKPESLPNGNIRLTTVITDITAERAIQQEVKQLSLVASKTSNAVVITDAQGLIMWVNNAFTTVAGYTLPEVRGKKPGAVLQGKDTNPAHVQKIREGLASKKSFVQEILNYHKNGTPYWLELNITPILNEQGEVMQFFGIEVDVTERKQTTEKLAQQNEQLKVNEQILSQNMAELQEVQQYLLNMNEQLEQNQKEISFKNEELASSEEELKQNLEELSATQDKLQVTYQAVQEKEAQISRLLNALPNCVFDSVLDRATGNYEIALINNTVEKIFGLTAEKVKQNFFALTELMQATDSQKFGELMAKAMKDLKPFSLEYRITKPNGKKSWLQSDVIPEQLPHGKVRMTSVVTDITERKQSEIAIQQQYELIQTSEEELRQNLEELNATQEQLQNQYNILAVKDKNIADSINYALRIQTALLPKLADIQQVFPESFVLFRPRDVISGDFYWFADKGNEQIMVAADCTGHGVPGAFMSMLGSSLINQIVHDKEIHAPQLILDFLHQGIELMLDQRKQESGGNRDGMDASICVIEQNKQRVHYAGANNSIFVVAEKALHFEVQPTEGMMKIETAETLDLENLPATWLLTDIKPDKKSAGGRVVKKTDDLSYTLRTFAIDQTLKIYMFSDGYADQLGGEHKRKIQSKGLKQLIMQHHTKQANEQRMVFNQYFEEWTATVGRQFDDVLLLGMEIKASS